MNESEGSTSIEYSNHKESSIKATFKQNPKKSKIKIKKRKLGRAIRVSKELFQLNFKIFLNKIKWCSTAGVWIWIWEHEDLKNIKNLAGRNYN